VGAEGTDAEGNPCKASTASAVTLQITDAASLSIANSAALSTAEKAGATAELVKFSVTVKNGALSFTDMDINLTGDSQAQALFIDSPAKGVYAEFDNGKRID
jgi:hypothetical protein